MRPTYSIHAHYPHHIPQQMPHHMQRAHHPLKSHYPLKSYHLQNPHRGEVGWGHIVAIILGILVFLIALVFPQKTISTVKDILSIVPSGCISTGKTTSQYQELLTNALKEDKTLEVERLYKEFSECRLEDPLDDETHFSIGTSVYAMHLKAHDNWNAPWILRDYARRIPRPNHHSEALNLIKEAEKLFEESPSGRFKQLTLLEQTDWSKAKLGYQHLIDTIEAQPQEYQETFSRERTLSQERYLQIEADQFRTRNLQTKAVNPTIDPFTGALQYTVRFEGLSPTPTYTFKITPGDRSVEHPTEPLTFDLTRDGVHLATNRFPYTLENSANIVTARAILDRLSLFLCPPDSQLSIPTPQLPTSPAYLPCAPAPIQTGYGAPLGNTLLPIPPPQPISGNSITFSQAPSLPTTLDPRSTNQNPTVHASLSGTPYIMDIIVEQYPTPAATIAWKDTAGNPIPEPTSWVLTRAALQTLCPAYHPPQPYTRDMTSELVRCIGARQIFSVPYYIHYEPLPTSQPTATPSSA